MDSTSSSTLKVRVETRLKDLADAKFGTFHESVKRFSVFFDQQQVLVDLSARLAADVPLADNIANRHTLSTGADLIADSDVEAAAVAEAFLRKISKEGGPPRAWYDNVYYQDNKHSDRLGNQNDNDQRSLDCVKDRFLRPFSLYITENLQQYGAPELDLANYDEGTGLLRKAVFEKDRERVFGESRSENEPLSLMMIDLDHFKSVNDTHGHPIGDEVLKAVGAILARTVKNRGRAYRFGGEEFAVLLPNHTASEASILAERLRRVIANEAISSKNLLVTASIGVAELMPDAVSSAQLVEQADKAMYEAKGLGRDLVRIFGEPQPLNKTEPVLDSYRKQPSKQKGFDKAARESIRLNYFQSGIARCPTDSARLEVRPYHIDERKTPDLEVNCPMCGLSDYIQGPE